MKFMNNIFGDKFIPFFFWPSCLGHFTFLLTKTSKLFGFPFFWLWAYLMKVIPETHRAHLIRFLCFYFFYHTMYIQIWHQFLLKYAVEFTMPKKLRLDSILVSTKPKKKKVFRIRLWCLFTLYCEKKIT